MRVKNKRATTLFEILTASLIFGLTIVALLGSFNGLTALLDLAKEQTIATADLRNMLERIRATPFDFIVTRFPDATPDGPGFNPYTAIVGGYRLNNEHLTVSYSNATSDPKEILVTVNWLDKSGRSKNCSVSTFRTR